MFIIVLFIFQNCHSFQLQPKIDQNKIILTKIRPSYSIRHNIYIPDSTIVQSEIDIHQKYIVLATQSKKIFVYNYKTGKLLHRIYLPFYKGKEGVPYTISISPIDEVFAVGGWTGFEWNSSYSIYVYSLITGKMIDRIDRLPNAIKSLTYSNDGQKINALLVNRGIVQIDLSQKKILFDHLDNSNELSNLKTDSENHLILTTNDSIRQYSKTLNLNKEVQLENSQISIFRISKDKSQLGIVDKNNHLKIYKNTTNLLFPLSHLKTVPIETKPDKTLIDFDFIHSQEVLLVWTDTKSRTTQIDRLNLENQTVSSMLTLTNENIQKVFVSSDQKQAILIGDSISLINIQNNQTVYRKTRLPDFPIYMDNILISKNGRIIQFSYNGNKKTNAMFSLDAMRLVVNADNPDGLYSNQTHANSFQMNEWKQSVPKFNDRQLKLFSDELSQTISIQNDEQSFVIGTNRFLRKYDNDGIEIWRTRLNSSPISVNISQTKDWVIVGFQDGNIKWYRNLDGKELFNLFIHADQKSWILYSPLGYYTFHENGDTLTHWTIQYRNFQFKVPVFALENELYNPKLLSELVKKNKTDKEIQSSKNYNLHKFSFKKINQFQHKLLSENPPKNGIGKIYSIDSKNRTAIVIRNEDNYCSINKSSTYSVQKNQSQIETKILKQADCFYKIKIEKNITETNQWMHKNF